MLASRAKPDPREPKPDLIEAKKENMDKDLKEENMK
jgi:hypothetical protein